MKDRRKNDFLAYKVDELTAARRAQSAAAVAAQGAYLSDFWVRKYEADAAIISQERLAEPLCRPSGFR